MAMQQTLVASSGWTKHWRLAVHTVQMEDQKEAARQAVPRHSAATAGLAVHTDSAADLSGVLAALHSAVRTDPLPEAHDLSAVHWKADQKLAGGSNFGILDFAAAVDSSCFDRTAEAALKKRARIRLTQCTNEYAIQTLVEAAGQKAGPRSAPARR